METTSEYSEHLRIGNDMMLRGAQIDEVRVKLLQRNITPSELDVAINEIRKNYYAKKTPQRHDRIGYWFLLVGFRMHYYNGIACVWLSDKVYTLRSNQRRNYPSVVGND
jgi:hypothetical protein